MLAALNHPNVLRFYGVVTKEEKDQTVVGIMTEFMPGSSLSNYLRQDSAIAFPQQGQLESQSRREKARLWISCHSAVSEATVQPSHSSNEPIA